MDHFFLIHMHAKGTDYKAVCYDIESAFKVSSAFYNLNRGALQEVFVYYYKDKNAEPFLITASNIDLVNGKEKLQHLISNEFTIAFVS